MEFSKSSWTLEGEIANRSKDINSLEQIFRILDEWKRFGGSSDVTGGSPSPVMRSAAWLAAERLGVVDQVKAVYNPAPIPEHIKPVLAAFMGEFSYPESTLSIFLKKLAADHGRDPNGQTAFAELIELIFAHRLITGELIRLSDLVKISKK